MTGTATVIREPDGSFAIVMEQEEFEDIKRRVEREEDLNDRETEIARMFELI